MTVKHKRVGGNRFWWTLCGLFGMNSDWRNSWPAVTCKRCLSLRGSTKDFLFDEVSKYQHPKPQVRYVPAITGCGCTNGCKAWNCDKG